MILGLAEAATVAQHGSQAGTERLKNSQVVAAKGISHAGIETQNANSAAVFLQRDDEGRFQIGGDEGVVQIAWFQCGIAIDYRGIVFDYPAGEALPNRNSEQ